MGNDTSKLYFIIKGSEKGSYGPRVFIHMDAEPSIIHMEAAKLCRWSGRDECWGCFYGYEFRKENSPAMRELISLLGSKGFTQVTDSEAIRNLTL